MKLCILPGDQTRYAMSYNRNKLFAVQHSYVYAESGHTDRCKVQCILHSISGRFEATHVDRRRIALTSVHPPGPYETALGDRTWDSGIWGRSFWCSGSSGRIYDSQSCVTASAHPTVSVRCCRHGVCAASVIDLCGQRRPSLTVRAVPSARARPAIREPGLSLSCPASQVADSSCVTGGCAKALKTSQQLGIEREDLERPLVMLTTMPLSWLRTLAAFLCESSAFE